jgi:hypothetical protein
MLMDVIPLNANLVKGSHGCRPNNQADWPILISKKNTLDDSSPLLSTDVYNVLRSHILE